jgi:serine/threonine protein kinase
MLVNMNQLELSEETASVKREVERESISLEELYRKFQEKDLDYKIYLCRENRYGQDEVFEIVGNLGRGRSCYVFLALIEKKLVSLRMSYEEADFKDKFDSVRVEMEDDYDEYLLNLLYPGVPVDYLCMGSVRKKNKLFFDRKVYASFWEKADASLFMKVDAGFENKLKWFGECLKGLRIIHARGRAHFDIKLENLFLVNNRLKIGDFEYYLKIEDFIHSNIYFCGTSGYIAPEMFYEKENVTVRIDIFSAGVAFARLFTGADHAEESVPALNLNINGEVILSGEEEDRLNTLFRPFLERLPNKKGTNAFKNNFKKFNFYRTCLQRELEKAGLPAAKREVYGVLLAMMNPDPAARPDAETIIRRIEKIPGISPAGPLVGDNKIQIPVFKINGTVVIVNLKKKPGIEIGSVKRRERTGNNNDNDINLRFVDISRRHLQLNYLPPGGSGGEEKIEICDLNSTHGVFVNNVRLEAGKPGTLITGDIIQLGNIVSFRFTTEGGFYLLKNITRERKRGNLLWLDKDQLTEIPDRGAVIILLKDSVSLAPFGAGDDTRLRVDKNGDIDVKGAPLKAVKGEVIL